MSQITITLNDLVLPRKGMKAAISEPHVIIYIDKQLDRVYAMDMTRDKKPTLLSYEKLILELESGDLTKGELDLPDYMKKSDKFIKSSQLSKRDKKFQIIKPILYDLETFLVSRNYGNRKISNCLEVAKNVGLKATRTQLYEWLYRYFRTGCNINAFLRKPGTGKSLEKKYTKKTGPKRASGVIGRMRNEIDNKHITKIVNQHIKCRNPKSIPAAFIEYEDTFASDPIVNAITGEITGYKRWDEEKRISEGQFKSYARELINKNIESFRAIQGKTDKFNKDQKGLSGDIDKFYAKGPGHAYQVDETPLDIELVDEFDPTRTKRLGKPTCYSVIDMFSRAWVALLLTFAKASAHTAREVLFVAFRDKEKFCQEIGVELTEGWSFSRKCRSIFVDNAEFKAELERAFSKDAQIEQIYNTEGNSQQKGLVERRHMTLEDFLYGKVPGVGRKKIDDYLKRNLRRDALINKRELYQILIDFITRYNNYYPLEDMPLTKEMRIDGVDPIPISKWNWGLVNRPGYLKSVSEEELYLSLLEVGEVTVHRSYLLLPGRFLKRRDGNNSKGLKYKCEWTKENGIQDLNEGPNQLPRLSCRFMRYSMGQIFIETEDGFKKAVLTEVDAAYQTMSDEEVRNDKIHQSNKLKNLKSKHDEKQGETRLKVSNIVAKAASEKAPISTHEANSQDITANREEAILREVKDSQNKFHEHTGSLSNASKEAETNLHDEDEPSLVTKSNPTASLFAEKMASRRNSRSIRGR